jgi:DNA-binding NarL/FixJ family response regulator
MRLHGAWMDALKETQALFRRYSEGIDRTPPAAAYYEQGEIHRLRGEYDDAEQAYRSASLHGRDPQPGLALLRLSQGDARAALAGLRSALASASSDARRLRLLPALLECLLELRDYDEAGAVLDELDRLAGSRHNCTELLSALISKARGAFLLASGETHEALRLLREAWPIYRDVDVPYEAARVRELIGRACLRLSDDEGGELELAAALQEFERLGAAPDADRVFKLLGARAEESPHGLSERELEVLRMVAAGKTNRRIAEELSLSRRTIDRHVSNIFSKLDVASRTAAAAYAIRRRLV